MQRTARKILKKNKVEGLTLPDFKNHHTTIVKGSREAAQSLRTFRVLGTAGGPGAGAASGTHSLPTAPPGGHV